MPSEPEFLPPIPQRLKPRAGLELLEESGSIDAFFAELGSRGGLIIEDRPASGTAVVTVARKAHGAEERVALLLATTTHMHRTHLEPFLLDRYDAFGAAFHLGAFELPRELRTEITLLPQDPWDPEVGQSRQRWRSTFALTEAPSRSLPVIRSSDGGEANLLALPGATPHRFTDDIGTRASQDSSERTIASMPSERWRENLPKHGDLKEEAWSSTVMNVPVRSWTWRPAQEYGAPEVTALVTDGDRYTSEYTLVPALERAVAEYALPPLSVIFFAPDRPSDRPHMLGANPDLPRFIQEELLPRASFHTRILSDPQLRAIAGASLGGLAAADVVRRAPDLVGCGIVQSASFWWPDEDSPSEQLHQWEENPAPSQCTRIFHEVGTLEGHLRAENRRFADLLRRLQIDHVSREYVGGHDYVCWRGGVIDGLIHFFGG